MDVSRRELDVRVSKRILWIGAEAYPLPDVTRLETISLEPNRKAAIRWFGIMTVVLLCAMAVAASVTSGYVATVAVLAGMGWIGYRLYKLVEFLNLKLYELDIEAAAAVHRGVISDDPKVVTGLRDRIIDAIDNPRAEFQVTVADFQIDDAFTMHRNNTSRGRSRRRATAGD